MTDQTMPEGTYIMCLSWLSSKTKNDRATYAVEAQILYSVDEDRPMSKKYTQEFNEIGHSCSDD